MNYNGYVNTNSIIHRMNPSIKFIVAIIFIILIFIPYGFILQIFLLALIISFYFLAKLPWRRLLKILLSILVMMIILTFVNWITYKGPGIVFDFNSKIYNIFDLNFNNWFNGYTSVDINGQTHLHGFIWGGTIPNGETLFGTNSFDFNNGFLDITGKTVEQVKEIKKSISDSGYKLVENLGATTNSGDLLTYTSGVLFAFKNEWYSMSSFALLLMINVSIKILLMILVVTILTSTTSSVELTYALEDILYPLKTFNLPVTVWSTTIALGIRFIPSLLDETDRIMKAQASRGLDFANGNIKDKLLSLTSFIVPLFSIAFQKADELANAMEARGYNPRYTRTRYRDYKIRALDLSVFIISIFILGFMIALLFVANKTIFISPLGPLEAIQIFGR